MLNETEKARLEQLKEAKAYNSTEYKELKARNEESGTEVQSTETVNISKEKLDGILSRLSELEGEKNKMRSSGGVEWEIVKEDEEHKTATLRCLDGKYCLGLQHKRTEFNERTREKDMVYEINWLLPDNTYEKTEMVLTEFASTVPRKEVKLLEKKVETMRRKTGRTLKIEPDYANYKNRIVGEVPTYETMDHIVYTVLLEDGRKLDLAADKLNQ